MINSIQMQQVVKETLERIGLASPEANSFVYHIGLVESKYQYLYQVGGSNIARGLYQCEPWVAVDICKNYLKYRDDLMRDVASACYLDWKYFTSPNEHDWRDILTYNIAAQISMCRLHLRRTTMETVLQYCKGQRHCRPFHQDSRSIWITKFKKLKTLLK